MLCKFQKKKTPPENVIANDEVFEWKSVGAVFLRMAILISSSTFNDMEFIDRCSKISHILTDCLGISISGQDIFDVNQQVTKATKSKASSVKNNMGSTVKPTS